MSDNVFCPIPWNFSAVRSNGDFRVCCHSNQSADRGMLRNDEGNIFNAQSASFSEVRNAKKLKAIRQQMLKGEWPKNCVRCENEEATGLRSRRIYERDAWHIDNEKAQSLTRHDGTIEPADFPIQYFDLRFGNKCNLACRMCGPGDSSGWYKDYKELYQKEYFNDTHGKVFFKKMSGGKLYTEDYQWYKSEKFWQELDRSAGQLKHIYMAGGEPLLIEQHDLFLKKCVEQNLAGAITLEYNTNLTVLRDDVVELWSHFRQVRVGASIDGYGHVFEYQRYPGKWDNVLRNLQKLDELANVESWLAVTITNYNIFHLCDFIKWKVKESHFRRISSYQAKPLITHHMCHSPKILNIKSLPNDLKQQVIGDFIAMKEWGQNELSTYEQKALAEILDGVERFMMSDDLYSSHWEDFISFTKKLDCMRGQDITKLSSHFKDYL